MDLLVEALLARAPDPLAEELRSTSSLATLLEAHVLAGRAAFPKLLVGNAEWVEFLVRHLRPGEVEAQLSSMRAADVHLALACASGSPAAHAVLDARLRAVTGQALTGIRLGPIPPSEVLQVVRTKLLVGEAGPGKLATYSGRGPLDGWLRVTLARDALSMLRARDPEAAREGESDALVNLAGGEDPQMVLLRARSAPALTKAIEQAVLALPAADRTLLRLHFVDGLTIDDLAAVYHAHRATMARRIARSRNAIFEGARARAMEALGLGETEFASLMGVMLSQIDLTMRTVFKKPEPTEGE